MRCQVGVTLAEAVVVLKGRYGLSCDDDISEAIKSQGVCFDAPCYPDISKSERLYNVYLSECKIKGWLINQASIKPPAIEKKAMKAAYRLRLEANSILRKIYDKHHFGKSRQSFHQWLSKYEDNQRP